VFVKTTLVRCHKNPLVQNKKKKIEVTIIFSKIGIEIPIYIIITYMCKYFSILIGWNQCNLSLIALLGWNCTRNQEFDCLSIQTKCSKMKSKYLKLFTIIFWQTDFFRRFSEKFKSVSENFRALKNVSFYLVITAITCLTL
jgi:hypothetical protein